MSRHRAAVLAFLLATTAGVASQAPAVAQPFVSVRVDVAPPPLPTYVQPVIPADGYLWVPGYWDWDVDFGYFWVPGTWVLPPRPNLLWTPGYWGWDDGVYVFHRGYWDVEVGYYGGIDYGYGYTGTGFQGGYWEGPRFFYNRSVTNITNISITNVYNKTVIVPPSASAVSYNGGAGGLTARPTPRQVVIAEQTHVQSTQAQQDQVNQARALPLLRASANHGAPPIAATPRAAAFHSPEVTPAKATGAPVPNAPQGAKVLTDEKLRGAAPAAGEAGRPIAPHPEASHAPAAAPSEGAQPAEKKRPEPTAAIPEARPKPPAEAAPVGRPAHEQPAAGQQDAAEAQRRAQAQAEAARRLQTETQARQKAEAEQQAVQHKQDAQRAAAAAEAQRRVQEQAAAQRQQDAQRAQQAEAARRLQAEAQARQAEAERQRAAQQQQQAQRAQQAAEQRAMATRQQAEQQAQQRAAQQRADEQRRAAEPARGAEPPREPRPSIRPAVTPVSRPAAERGCRCALPHFARPRLAANLLGLVAKR